MNDAMWLKRWGWVTDSKTVTSDPIQIQKDYNKWLAEEWDSVVRSPDNGAYTNPGNIRHDAMWLAEEWKSIVGSTDINLSFPTEIRKACREWLAENWNSIIHAVDNNLSHPSHVRIYYNEWLKSQEDSKASHACLFRRITSMWLANEWESTRRITPTTSDPIQIQKDYNEWLAEEWNSVIQPLDNSETHPKRIRSGVQRLDSSEVRSNAMWLAENWESTVASRYSSESHPTRSAAMWWAGMFSTDTSYVSTETHLFWRLSKTTPTEVVS